MTGGGRPEDNPSFPEHSNRAAIQALGKRVIRQYGAATAWARALPDFLIIGTKRGGTTSLYRHLLRHPAVLPMFPTPKIFPLRKHIKAVRYFDTGFHHPPRWYRGHFPTTLYRSRVSQRVGGPVVSGEASPYYLFHPLAAERASRLVPETKIIVLLRNPIDRAFSHYKERCREGVEELTFEEAIDAEPARLAGEAERLRADPQYYSYAHEHLSYVSQSLYAKPMKAWLEHFPRSSILVLRSEDLYAEGERVVGQILDFLGLAPAPIGDLPVLNTTARSPLDSSVRDRLAERMAPDVSALEADLGMSLGWNLTDS